MKTVISSLVTLLLLSACASTPTQTANNTPAPTPEPRKTTPRPQIHQAPLPGSVAGSREEFQKMAGDRVHFALDSYALSYKARSILSKQAAWLNRYPRVRILVEGNCDERGTREYNLALGAQRASAVRDYLVNLGVSPSRISTISYGKERPIDGRSNEEAWAINRNAHSAITSGAVS